MFVIIVYDDAWLCFREFCVLAAALGLPEREMSRFAFIICVAWTEFSVDRNGRPKPSPRCTEFISPRNNKNARRQSSRYALMPRLALAYVNTWFSLFNLEFRFAEFVEGKSHLSDREVLDYETSELAPDDADPWTDDESDDEWITSSSQLPTLVEMFWKILNWWFRRYAPYKCVYSTYFFKKYTQRISRTKMHAKNFRCIYVLPCTKKQNKKSRIQRTCYIIMCASVRFKVGKKRERSWGSGWDHSSWSYINNEEWEGY